MLLHVVSSLLSLHPVGVFCLSVRNPLALLLLLPPFKSLAWLAVLLGGCALAIIEKEMTSWLPCSSFHFNGKSKLLFTLSLSLYKEPIAYICWCKNSFVIKILKKALFIELWDFACYFLTSLTTFSWENK